MQIPNHPSVKRSLSATELIAGLARLDGWKISGDGPEMRIEKSWDWPGFHESMAFANAVAFVAGQRNHHPDLLVQYLRCTVRWRTHDAGGITRADLECAALTDALVPPQPQPQSTKPTP
ncbi:MAG: 4a-hydroxytetrahydrobiopterin dehydratase [Burkholderiaceae bacterium]|nr:4a-hydroxytetrahydrobiopterin dehydratase [Burkholderiaceae bacterium]